MSAGPYLYVPNETDNTVSVIDTSSNTVVATIPVGGNDADTAAISPNGAFVYVASESGQIAVISTATNSLVTVIPVPGARFYTVAVSPDGSLVYATNINQNEVTVIDAQANSIITNIPVATFPYGIAFSPDGKLAYVTSESGTVGNTVSVINTATNSVLTTITVGAAATMLAVSPDGQHAYVSNNGSGTVSVIDTSKDLVTTNINVGGNPYGIVVSPDGSHVYVANADGNVSVIDTATNSVVDTINVGVENVGIAVSPDGTHLYVTHYGGGGSATVSVIDTATNLVVGTINVGNVPEYPAIIGAPQLDHWQNSLGGNWATATNWKHGTPTANIAADIDTTGTYSVAITTNDIAYGLFLNDAQATVTDKGGALTLAGSGGATNPNGALNINAGTFVLDGGGLKAGTISISSGGTFLIAKGTYAGSSALSETIINGGSLIDNTTATIMGNISGTGTILAENNAHLTIDGSLTAFTGSFTIANKAVLEFGTADFGNVAFASGFSGTVKFDAPLTAPLTALTGTISGLTPNDKIDLADLKFVPGKTNASYDPSTGNLIVTNGSQQVSLHLSGNFTNATWVVSKDATGGTVVVDPPAPSPANGPPGFDHVVALFTQSMAGFSDQHGNGALSTNPLSQVLTNQEQFLANPHHG
jgi:YVTN family beta-propeller protein